jgi:hypothetical protein
MLFIFELSWGQTRCQATEKPNKGWQSGNALDSRSSGLRATRVQIPSPAPYKKDHFLVSVLLKKLDFPQFRQNWGQLEMEFETLVPHKPLIEYGFVNRKIKSSTHKAPSFVGVLVGSACEVFS